MKRILLGLCIGTALAFPFLAYTLSPTGKTIKVSVSIKQNLLPEKSDGWPLYIYAARPNTRLPLSSYKGKVSDLPISITLDESMYLLPELTLKDAKQVVVVAKISKSTDPHKKSEQDLIGFSRIVSFDQGLNQQVSLVIDQTDKITK
ncbi:hypothetical protein [Aliikangiella sp. G2MR2-5]|uniref:c-type cytochrome biogenesis protein CcmI/CycH n=1 Tax=Aliikangiella sp. G2MR2-5 TaxID=2788943 RepID=UPI0018A8FA20|nr:hypothetical protein [Aliikangiella sp. G2MR2-5]